MDGWQLASIFAQGSHDQNNVIGMIFVGVVALLSGGLVVKQLLEKRADKEAVPRKEFDELKSVLTNHIANAVTRKDFDELKATVVSNLSDAVSRKEFDELKVQASNNAAQLVALTGKLVDYVTRREMDDLRSTWTQQYEKLERYARNRNHKLTAQVHEIQMGIEVLHRNMQAEMSSLINRVTDKQERHQTSLTELRAIVERRLPKPEDEVS